MGLRKFTVADFVEALSQNNIPFASGNLAVASTRTFGATPVIGSACAIGQGAINLGVEAETLEIKLRGIVLTKGTQKGVTLGARIIGLNDSYKMSPDSVAKLMLNELTEDQLSTVIEVPTKFWINTLRAS